MKIGVFDSGVGGLTILKNMLDLKPNNSYIYVADTKNFPFGTKSKDELDKIAKNILDYFSKIKVDLVVVACGTMCTSVIKGYKDKYNFRIINIVDHLIDYIKHTSYHKIGLLATTNTVKSNYIQDALQNRIVYSLDAPRLVESIEFDSKIVKELINVYVDKLIKKEVDILILGCTHFNYIKDLVNVNVPVVCLGSRVAPLLPNTSKKNVNIYFTKLNKRTIANVNRIMGKNYKVKTINFSG